MSRRWLAALAGLAMVLLGAGSPGLLGDVEDVARWRAAPAAGVELSISSVSCTCSPERFASATGRVCRDSSVSTTNGHMKSFQAERKVKTASVTRIGRSSGSTIVQ